jgi:pilus assembly protein TadC
MGGVGGLVAGVVVAVVSVGLLKRLAADDAGADREALAGQAPEVAELLAACLAAGAGLEPAAAAVAAAVEQPAAGLLSSAVAHLRLGAPPEEALAAIAAQPELAPISRAISRSLDSGAPLVTSLTLCAEELRNTRRAMLQTKARQVAVRTVGPLGLCFLPAFLVVGVVPLVAGLLQRSLTGIGH